MNSEYLLKLSFYGFFLKSYFICVKMCQITQPRALPYSLHRLVPNCVMKAKSERRKQFIGSQIDDCKDLSGLYYILPFQKVSSVVKGYVHCNNIMFN